MPKYTRYHYNEIARILRTFTFGEQNELLCQVFADVFEKDNPRFKPTEWWRACRRKG